MRFLIVIPYSLTYTWEERDTRAQTRDGGEQYRDERVQDSPCLAQKWDTSAYKTGTTTLYSIKEEVTHDD